MTQTRLQSYLDYLWAHNGSATRRKLEPKLCSGPEMSFFLLYLDLSREGFSIVLFVHLCEALCHLGGLVHSQEPEVTVVDVHDGPQVADVGTQLLILLSTGLCHACCYRLHRVEDDWGDLQAQTHLSDEFRARLACVVLKV